VGHDAEIAIVFDGVDAGHDLGSSGATSDSARTHGSLQPYDECLRVS
jgi:hypothetical protein